jgi:hypothetical protein
MMAGILVLDRWLGVHSESLTTPNPSWDDVRNAIVALDQSVHTQVFVTLGQGPTLLVGGGRGRFSVSLDLPDKGYWTLHDDDDVEGEEQLVVGGQLGVYDRRQVVSLRTALRAAKSFLTTQQPDPTLTWTFEASA